MKILLFLAITTLAWAEPMMIPVGHLRLLDGRTLENVVIRSYDAQASKVLVIANGKALLIPIALIPPPYADKAKAIGASASSAADLVQTTPVPAYAPTAPATTPPQTEAVTPPPPPPQPTTPRRVPVAPVAEVADPRKAHQDVAKAYALRYFKYAFRAGSNAISVTDSDIEIDETEPVYGWDRYRTTGKVYIEFYDSVGGGSFSRRAEKFDAVTEQKPGEEIKVVDFTRK